MTWEKIRELRQEVDIEWSRSRRIEYLEGVMTEEVTAAMSTLSRYRKATRGIEIGFFGWCLLERIKRILKIQGDILRMKGATTGITDEMIERAKEYPFDQLIDLRGNRAKCPFHDGKSSSSFSVKDNYGYCFGCGWKGDTITYVMDKDGGTFNDAVRRLQ